MVLEGNLACSARLACSRPGLSLHSDPRDSECGASFFRIFFFLGLLPLLVECAHLNVFTLILKGIWCCQFLSFSGFCGVNLVIL